MKTLQLLFVWLLSVAGADLRAAPCTLHPATRLIFAIDMSTSIREDQRREWLPTARQLVACLVPGDSLFVYGLHAHTAESKPWFAKDYPVKPKHRDLTALRRWADERQEFVQGSKRTLDAAFSFSGAAKSTDIFALFGRIKTDPARRTVLVLYTDGLHSTRGLDFETQRLDPRRFPALIRALGERYGWTVDTVLGTHIGFVLPSVGCCETTEPVNSRLVLEKFYRALAQALNCTLDNFETQLEPERIL